MTARKRPGGERKPQIRFPRAEEEAGIACRALFRAGLD